jgi:hypothetical protein
MSPSTKDEEAEPHAPGPETLHAGACHHALGYFIEAVRDYERAMSVESPDLTDDARSRQFLSFYQREMALYVHARLDTPVADYSLDRDLHPVFKVGCPA